MKTLLIAKSGTVFRMRHAGGHRQSGEVGETEAIINHLSLRNDINLVYFGVARGDLPCEVIAPHLDDLTELSTAKFHAKCLEADLASFAGRDVCGFIHVSGYSPTMSMIDNPNGIQVQACSVRYSAPQLHVIEKLKLRRVVINNDPRCYPKDQEMSLGWPHCRPAALLDQWTHDVYQTVGGVRYRRVSVYAGVEQWCHHEPLENKKMHAVSMVAHAHIKDGIKNRARDNALCDMFQRKEALREMGLKVYGTGWEHFSMYDERMFPGSVKQNVAIEIISSAKCQPIISHTPGFYTGKMSICLAQGCLPIFWARGEFAYDSVGLYNCPRAASCDVLLNLIRQYDEDESARLKALALCSVEPNWSMLDDVVDRLVCGRELNHGGYFLR